MLLSILLTASLILSSPTKRMNHSEACMFIAHNFGLCFIFARVHETTTYIANLISRNPHLQK